MKLTNGRWFKDMCPPQALCAQRNVIKPNIPEGTSDNQSMYGANI